MLALLCAAPAVAQHIAIELVPETRTPAAGSTVTLALASTPEAGWHGYWENPGDAGLPPKLTWTLPDGVRAGALRYPVPQRLMIAGLMNHVYEGPFAQLVTLTVPKGLAAGTPVPVRLKADYLVCTATLCVPESQALTTRLVVGDGAVDTAMRAKFDAWRRALPQPLGTQATYQVEGGRVRIGVPWPADVALDTPYFFAKTDGVVDYAAPQKVVRDGDRLVIETGAKGAGGRPLAGVLATGDARGFVVEAPPGVVEPVSHGGWIAVLAAFGGALLGGVLLNIMPCVFPILSLKALSLAKSGGSERHARTDALAYTAGVVSAVLALGGLLLALRAGGAQVGWAFQLQDPRVIVLLLLLTVAITLNLVGLFEVPVPRFAGRAGDTGGAFLTGALAAFVATPCTGPFMGAALGAALVLPWGAALAVFGGLGLGIALPFLAVGFVPAVRRRLPKPGAWMVTFRRVLAAPMALTAVALAWVLVRQAGDAGLAVGLGAAAVLGVALAWGGRRQATGRSWGLAAVPMVLAAAAVALVQPAPAGAVLMAGAERFSEARLAALRAQGRPVFAYFTADWCVTCKVNEKAAIETVAVREAFAKGRVAVLVGDWTDGDPALGRFLEAHGRAGVPLYLWYAPGAKAPRVLPQVLTPGMVAGLVGAKD